MMPEAANSLGHQSLTTPRSLQVALRVMVENQVRTNSIALWLLLFSLASFTGCGSDTGGLADSPAPSPVGGMVMRLPKDVGTVAIKTETPAASKGAKGKSRLSTIVAVFFKNDGSTPLSPPPTDVVFELELLHSKTDKLKPVKLEADPSEPNRFVSEPGSFPGGVAGKIRLKLNGEELEESFSAR